MVADELSRPVQNIRVVEDMWLGKTREELVNLQRQDWRWREMIDYLQGGRIPRSKYPKATLDLFALEDEILYSESSLYGNSLSGKFAITVFGNYYP